jgi:hypothetical protein
MICLGMRFIFAWTFVVMVGLSFSGLRAADVSIQIVEQSSTAKKAGDSRCTYDVVLTNTSRHRLSIWDEACSWGYYNLSFEFSRADGRVVRVEKTPIDFTMNEMSGHVLDPGKQFIFQSAFRNWDLKDFQEWTHTDVLKGKMTMKAIYKNTNAPFPGKKPDTIDRFDRYLVPGEDGALNPLLQRQREFLELAWIGRVESQPIKITILR